MLKTFVKLLLSFHILAPAACTVAEGRKAVFVDLDNTLYRSSLLEGEIVSGIHQHVRSEHGVGKDEADLLHEKHGSTVDGLRRAGSNFTLEDAEAFYEGAYRSVRSYGELLPSPGGRKSVMSTGYSSSSSNHRKSRYRFRWLPLLESLSKSSLYDFHITSNSPLPHISACLRHMGLGEGCFKSIVAPSPRNSFITKSDARFYDQIPLADGVSEIVVLDDNERILETARGIRRASAAMSAVPVTTIRVNSTFDLHDALLRVASAVDSDFSFVDKDYLKAKNEVDDAAINCKVWDAMKSELLSASPEETSNSHLKIVDIGCGLLNLLRRFVSDQTGLLPSNDSRSRVKSIDYYAYEGNANLLPSITDALTEMGFSVSTSPNEQTFFREFSSAKTIKSKSKSFLQSIITRFFPRRYAHSSSPAPSVTTTNVTVHLRMQDFRSEDWEENDSTPTPHLIVGSCVADLFDPDELSQELRRIAGKGNPLLYFPITYAGMTILSDPSTECKIQNIPSDTMAMRMYNDALTFEVGHNLNPSLFIDALSRFGGRLIAKGNSVWRIRKRANEYLWNCMVYFFGSTACGRFSENGYTIENWLNRLKAHKKDVSVWNLDILARFEDVKEGTDDGCNHVKQVGNVIANDGAQGYHHEIVFKSPKNVSRRAMAADSSSLEADEVLITPLCSLISSGTELKIFRGDIDTSTDEPLDTTITSMKSESFSYPLTYGYCLVGLVREAGRSENAQKLVGRTVFTFSPHCTNVRTNYKSVIVVPAGIDPYRAIFLPSIETAISLIHDAGILPGEKVGVVGQGLIGLLVTGILSHHKFDVTTFEMIDDRQALSSLFGANAVLSPFSKDFPNDLDVIIEVTGVGGGLQTAIDRVGDGGRVVIGSLYPTKDKVSLKLGMDFHRSKKKLICSQVSTLPAKLSQRWTKERRFDFAWSLVEHLPLERILEDIVGLDDAQAAFDMLDRGEHSAIAFNLTKPVSLLPIE